MTFHGTFECVSGDPQSAEIIGFRIDFLGFQKVLKGFPGSFRGFIGLERGFLGFQVAIKAVSEGYKAFPRCRTTL